MLDLFRKNQKWVMGIVATIIILAFAFFGDFSGRSDAGLPEDRDYIQVAGKTYSWNQLKRLGRGYTATRDLFGQASYYLANGYVKTGIQGPGMPLDYVLNLMALRDHAPKFGIVVSSEEIQARMKSHPRLGNPQEYAQLVKEYGQYGMVEGDLEQVVEDAIMLEKLRELLSSGLHVNETSGRYRYARENHKVYSSFIKIPNVEPEDVEVTEKQIEEEYEKRKDTLMTPQKVAISYVFIGRPAPPDFGSLGGDEETPEAEETPEPDTPDPDPAGEGGTGTPKAEPENKDGGEETEGETVEPANPGPGETPDNSSGEGEDNSGESPEPSDDCQGDEEVEPTPDPIPSVPVPLPGTSEPDTSAPETPSLVPGAGPDEPDSTPSIPIPGITVPGVDSDPDPVAGEDPDKSTGTGSEAPNANDPKFILEEYLKKVNEFDRKVEEFSREFFDEDGIPLEGVTFKEVAGREEYQLEVIDTEPFSAEDLPEDLKTQFQLLRQIFDPSLIGQPVSYAVPGSGDKDGYFFFKINEVVKPKPMTLEDAKEPLEKSLRADIAREKTSEKVDKAREQIESAMKEGKDFAEACKAAGYEAQEIKPISMQDIQDVGHSRRPLEPAELYSLMSSIFTLKPGEISESVELGDGKALVIVTKRELWENEGLETGIDNARNNMARDQGNHLLIKWFETVRNERQEKILMDQEA